MVEITDLMAFSYNITWYCYQGAIFAYEGQAWTDFYAYETILTNFLYNLGYIYRDIIYFFFMTPEEAEGYGKDYSYAIGYLVGDFFIRFIYVQDDTIA